jgi:DNA-binding NtrC family response regulator
MPSYTLLWTVNSPNPTAPAGSEWLEALSDFDVVSTAAPLDALTRESLEAADCVLVSGEFADLDGTEIVELVRSLDPRLPVVFWSPDLSASEAARLVHAGARHCIGHGDTPDRLRDCLRLAADERRRKVKMHRASSSTSDAWRSLLVGESRAMQVVSETIAMIAPRRSTVLITGESGTGKEMAARALHLAGPRANQPFVPVNCTALPENLLEAELFGHIKGAFTGAVNSRIGRFEQAHRGTIFLDEVGDMPIELQSKLLRVLQDREIQRLGSSETVKVDVRVIAATNVSLIERVRQGRFREDLYYRLNVVPLEMPPLRARESDIPLLVEHFVRKISNVEGLPVKQVSPEAINRLRACPWPGNVRQLENAVEMAVAISGHGDVLYPGDFGLAAPVAGRVIPFELPAIPADMPESVDFDSAVSQFERTILERALRKTAGNKTAAAEMLGLKRTTLIMKLRSFDGAKLCAC